MPFHDRMARRRLHQQRIYNGSASDRTERFGETWRKNLKKLPRAMRSSHCEVMRSPDEAKRDSRLRALRYGGQAAGTRASAVRLRPHFDASHFANIDNASAIQEHLSRPAQLVFRHPEERR
jgi:hypothetical protein